MKLRSVDPKMLKPEVYQVFGTQNALLTAGNRNECNTMTIGWCQLGWLWNQPVCTVFVRPERYTYEFTEKHDYFTVSVLPADAKKIMAFCGSKSGRAVDKLKECGLTLCYGEGEAPFFEEAELVLVCKKIYQQDLDPAGVLEGKGILPFYEKGGWHRMYAGRVEEAYLK